MSGWIPTGSGTFRRDVRRSRRDRRCFQCGSLIPAGSAYSELRAGPWFEFADRFYGYPACGPTTEDCRAPQIAEEDR